MEKQEDGRIQAWYAVVKECNKAGLNWHAEKNRNLSGIDIVCGFIRQLAAKAKAKRK